MDEQADDTPGALSARIPVVLRMPATPDSLTVARQVATGVARAAGMTGEGVEDVKVAVTEACTNAVRHAYGAGRPGSVTLAAWVDGGLLHLSVRDRGEGFSPESAFQAGVGLLTIRAIARDAAVRSDGANGTEVTMSFALSADA